MTRGKQYESTLEKFDRQHLYTVGEAIDLVKELAHAKFDETVELAVRLGVDPRKADQIVRGTLSLPHGTGRTVRVAVFAAGDPATKRATPGRITWVQTTWLPTSKAGSSTSTSRSPRRT